MSAQELIAALDAALLGGAHEEVILRRVVGSAPNQVNVDVMCIARVDAVNAALSAPGPKQQVYDLTLSPTQINHAQWPGGTVPALPPFNIDQRIPRVGGPDVILMRGENPRTVIFSDPKLVDGEPVRLNLRIAG